jgi:tetratricopeptide (TPR) repeat protein
MSKGLSPWLVLLLLAGMAFALACRLVPPPGSSLAGSASSTAQRLFCASRAGLAATAIEQADVYLHRGLQRVHAEAFHNTWFQRMEDRVSLRGVAHREGADSVEVVPWLWLGTTMDPDNIDYALMSAYWLRISGHDDLAWNVLRDSLVRHPRDPRLHLERGRMFLRDGRTRDAANALDAGLAFAAGGTNAMVRGVIRSLTTYRGLIYESEGNTNAAMALYSADLEQAGELLNRAADLRDGRAPQVPAAMVLSNLVHVAHRCEHHEGEVPHADAH